LTKQTNKNIEEEEEETKQN